MSLETAITGRNRCKGNHSLAHSQIIFIKYGGFACLFFALCEKMLNFASKTT